MTNPPNIDAIIAELSELERDLTTGNAKGWGSWMWGVSGDLIGKGLFEQTSPTERGFSPLGLAVRSALIGEAGRDG